MSVLMPAFSECVESIEVRSVKVAYIMSRFPKLTETFVLYEMLAVEQLGYRVALYPLRRERGLVMHPEAGAAVQRAHFQPIFSWKILGAHMYFLWCKPFTYLRTVAALLFGTLGSLRFFVAAVIYFPKMVYFAYRMAADGVTHVHAHFANHPAAAAFVIRRLTGIPYSFTAHGSDLHCDRTMLRQKVAEAAFVVAISQYNRERIVEECGEECRDKVIVIHCGVDMDVFQPIESAVPLQGPGGLDILCVGTLHEVKGQEYLIEACRLLQERGIQITCHLIGDGPGRAALVRQSRAAQLDGRVHFHGLRTRQEIAQWFRQAAIVVAPSVPTSDGRREGIPVVLMEAMASGAPVIASRISGIPELVEDGRHGLLVPPRDARALADAIQQLCEDPELRRRLGCAGRQRVAEQFNMHENAAALAQLFTPSLAI
jgi:glycosyltransferase involved in cell wall biosynthesis